MAEDIELPAEEGQDEGQDLPFRSTIGTEGLPEDPPEEPEKPAPAPDPTVEDLKKQLATLSEVVGVQKQWIEQKKQEPRVVHQPVQAPPTPTITREQLADLFVTDPVAASAYISSRAVDEVRSNYETRMQSFAASAAQTTENAAKQRFADDFADFGDEILQQMAMATMEERANPAVWELVIDRTRGKNVDKVVERKMAALQAKQKDEAQKAERERVAAASSSRTRRVSAAPDTPSNGTNGTYGLTAEQQRVAQIGGLTFKEYADGLKLQRGR